MDTVKFLWVVPFLPLAATAADRSKIPHLLEAREWASDHR